MDLLDSVWTLLGGVCSTQGAAAGGVTRQCHPRRKGGWRAGLCPGWGAQGAADPPLSPRPAQRTQDELELIFEELLHIKAVAHLSNSVSAAVSPNPAGWGCPLGCSWAPNPPESHQLPSRHPPLGPKSSCAPSLPISASSPHPFCASLGPFPAPLCPLLAQLGVTGLSPGAGEAGAGGRADVRGAPARGHRP